jgi:hypothetical protein
MYLGLAIAAACTAQPAQADPAPGVTFTKIVDTNTVIPAGHWAGQNFGGFHYTDALLPALRNGRVLFVGGPPSTSGAKGLFEWDQNGISLLVDPSTPPPLGSVPFEYVEYPALDEHGYGFVADSVYRNFNGALTRVEYTRVNGRIALDGEETWYTTVFYPSPGGAPTYRLKRADASGVHTEVITDQPTPEAPGHRFVGITQGVSAAAGKTAFWASSSPGPGLNGMSGLYEWSGGSITRIVDSAMQPFAGGLSSFDFDGSTTAFLASAGIFKARDGVIEPVAMSGATAPGGGVFSFTPDTKVAVDEGHIAFFTGIGNLLSFNDTLYSDFGGSLERIIGREDILFGKRVRSVGIGAHCLSGNQLVFVAGFYDNSGGIFLATVPEPSGILGILIGSMLFALRHQNKSLPRNTGPSVHARR